MWWWSKRSDSSNSRVEAQKHMGTSVVQSWAITMLVVARCLWLTRWRLVNMGIIVVIEVVSLLCTHTHNHMRIFSAFKWSGRDVWRQLNSLDSCYFACDLFLVFPFFSSVVPSSIAREKENSILLGVPDGRTAVYAMAGMWMCYLC